MKSDANPNDQDKNMYSVYIYFNDRLQVNVTYKSRVLANDGHLYIGKDPWFQGAKSMIGDLKIYNRQLSYLEIRNNFMKTTLLHSYWSVFRHTL